MIKSVDSHTQAIGASFGMSNEIGVARRASHSSGDASSALFLQRNRCMKRLSRYAVTTLLLIVSGYSLAQSSPPAVGHIGQLISPSGQQYMTNGYVECLNQCGVSLGVPDAATLQALQYADQNNLAGELFYETLQAKFIDVCRVDYSNIIGSVCTEYQSSPVSGAAQIAGSWTGISGPFLSVDVCMQYYPVSNHLADKVKWPEACGPYPNSHMPFPVQTPVKTPMDNGLWTCEIPAENPSTMICSKPG